MCFSPSIRQISSLFFIYFINKANFVHSEIEVCNKFILFPIKLFKKEDFPVEYFPTAKNLIPEVLFKELFNSFDFFLFLEEKDFLYQYL